MENTEPAVTVVDLSEKCPSCKSILYTYWHTPASDQPGLGLWFIECTKCDFEVEESFLTLDAAKQFEAPKPENLYEKDSFWDL